MRVLATLAVLAYPLLIFFFLDEVGAKGLGIGIVALMLLRYSAVVKDNRWLIVLAALVVGFLFYIQPQSSERVLRLYPTFISLSLLAAFAFTLVRPPSMAERLAQLSNVEITPVVKRYTRNVTVIWCCFFAINAGVSALIAMGGSLEVWTLYNGLISYLLVAAIMGIEYLYRQQFIARQDAAT
jgi:uncharacterized membrane protein